MHQNPMSGLRYEKMRSEFAKVGLDSPSPHLRIAMLRHLSLERPFPMLMFTGFLVAHTCLAQTSATGSFSGTVVDDSGKPVAATVTASGTAVPPANARTQTG